MENNKKEFKMNELDIENFLKKLPENIKIVEEFEKYIEVALKPASYESMSRIYDI